MEVAVLRPAELDGAELERWRAHHRSTPGIAHPHLAPDFARAVGEVRSEARLSLVSDNGRRGWFAFESYGRGIGEVVGKGFTDTGGIPQEGGMPAVQPDILLRASGLSVWRCTQLDPAAGPFGPPAPPGRLLAGTRTIGKIPNPVVDLRAGYPAYLESRRTSARSSLQTLRKHERRLERLGMAVRFRFNEPDPAVLQTLLRWKDAQYRATGWTNPLSRHQGSELTEHLARLRAPTCAGTTSVLYIDDEPAAIQFSLRSATVLACCITAYDRRFAPFSPGSLLLLRLIEAACADGIVSVDLGTGDQPYKGALMTRQLSLPEGLMLSPGLAAGACLLRDTASRVTRDFITSRPALRTHVRQTLRRYGTLRSPTA